MAETTIGKVLAAMEAEPHRGCSDLYRWLRQHHAALTAALLTHRSPLRVLLKHVHEAGIVGRQGQRVSYEIFEKDVAARLPRCGARVSRRHGASGTPLTHAPVADVSGRTPA